MKDSRRDQFLFGASYAPYALGMDWPMEEWESDFSRMKNELGFNTIRIFAPWERMERPDGTYDWTKQDFAMDLAEKYDLNVILNFGGLFGSFCGMYVPQFYKGIVCADNPEYREHVERFMRACVCRYCSRKNLLAWMSWNEPAGGNCVCEDTLRVYREWLRKKYQTLEALNQAWSANKTLRFKTWEEVGREGSSLVASADWNFFRQWHLADQMNAIRRIVKENDPEEHPVTCNFVYHLAAMEGDCNSVTYGLDIGLAAQSLDVMGISCYSVEHKADIEPAHVQSYKLARLHSVAPEESRRVWVLETGAGPNMKMITPAQRIRFFYQMIGHNVKSLILWNYRSRISEGQVALFNLMKWDGTISRRAKYMSDFGKMLQKNASLLNRVQTRNQAAVMTLEMNQVLMHDLCGDHRPEFYRGEHDSRTGAYKLFWDMKIGADTIQEQQLEKMNEYKVILLPMMEHITPEIADGIRHYVENGGTVIAEGPMGFRDGRCMLQYHAPGFGLAEVFGGFTADREGIETAPEILCPEGSAKVCRFWSEYVLSEGGIVLAEYDNGEPAVIAKNYGRGRAVLAGTEIFRQYVRDPQPAMTKLLTDEIRKSGVIADMEFHGNSDGIEVCRLAGEGGILYILLNHSGTGKDFSIVPRDRASEWTALETGRCVDLSRVHLEPEEVLSFYTL